MLITRTILFLFFVLFLTHQAYTQATRQNIEIRGTVTDRQTKEVLSGAFVYLKETKRGTRTDAKGQYVLNLPPGAHTLCASLTGYRTQEFKVHTDTLATFPVELESYVQELTEVVVSGRSSDHTVSSPEMGVERMHIEEIRRLPSLMGEVDLLKGIQLLPGVQMVSEGGSGFSVRGGAPDQNLILLDNTTVYNASHLFGFFSVFNHDVIHGLELYKGDPPLKYGGRLSSLLSVETKSNRPDRFQGTGGIGLIATRVMLEGPLGERTSWFVGGRRSYADLFLKLSSDEALRNSAVYFYDLNAKITHRFSDKDKLELNGYYGKDVFSADMGGFDYGNAAVSVNWGHLFTDRFRVKSGIHLSDYQYGLESKYSDTHMDWKAGIFDLGLKIDFLHEINSRMNLNYGISSLFHHFSPGLVTMTGQSDYEVEGNNALEHGIYLSNEHKISRQLNLRYGVRLAVFQNMGQATAYHYDKDYQVTDSTRYGSGDIFHTYLNLEPRISASYRLNETSSVKANYAHNVQFIQLAENSSAGSPVSMWFPASPNVKPQTVDLFSAGYFRTFQNNTYEASVEAYYKKLNHVIDFAEHAELLLNRYMEGEIRTGKGRAYGVELSIKKSKGRLTGFLNYTLSRSERTIPEVNQGKTYLAPYDKTHSINLSATYELSKKWSASAVWVYATGNPTTYPTGRFEIGGEYFPIYSGRNEYRKPDYHRLDLSVNYVPKPDSPKRWRGEWNFSIYNAYGRKNAWLIQYDQSDTPTPVAEKTYLFGIVPSVTYNFKF